MKMKIILNDTWYSQTFLCVYVIKKQAIMMQYSTIGTINFTTLPAKLHFYLERKFDEKNK